MPNQHADVVAPAQSSESDEQVLRHVKATLGSFGRWCRSGPVSVVVALLTIAVYVVIVAVGRETLEPYIAAGIGHGWWTFATAVFWTNSLGQVVLDVLLLLSVGIWMERTIGSLYYAVVGFATYWLSVGLTLLLVLGINGVDHQWGELLSGQSIVGPVAFLIGVACAASNKMQQMWRRRILTFVFTFLLMMVLFAGYLGTIFAVVIALVGFGAGALVWRDARIATETTVMPHKDGRTLIALTVAGIVIGTLVSLFSTEMTGVLSLLKYAAEGQRIPIGELAALCTDGVTTGECNHYDFLVRDGQGFQFLAVMPLLLQLVLAWGLRRGRRAAWLGTLLLQGLTALVALINLGVSWNEVKSWSEGANALGFTDAGLPTARLIIPVVVPVIILIVTLASSRLFTVRAVAGTYRRLWAKLGLITAATWAVLVIVALFMRLYPNPWETLWVMTVEFVVRLFPSAILTTVTPLAQDGITDAQGLPNRLQLIPGVAPGILLLRSFRLRQLPGAISREEYTQLVRDTNAGSMAWMSTWDGNHYWKSASYEAGIAFRADQNVALTVTEPAARPEDLEEVLREFVFFCGEQGLTPALYSVHSPVVEITDKWGWPRLEVAEETVLNLPDLAFKGGKFQPIRSALNRAQKENIRTEWFYYDDLPADYLAQIKAISEQWVDEKPLPEMGFTLGGVAELDDPDVRILVAVDENEVVQGVTSWMPIFADGKTIGWTLDFMRRLNDGFPPVMQYLIASAALWGQQEGYQVLSLSGAPLAHAKNSQSPAEDSADEGSSAAALDTLLDFLGRTLEPVYGFRSLLKFKAKFQPEYVPVYLVVPTVGSLPMVGLAISHAYLPNMSFTDTVHLGQALLKR